jgi:hypothetical protein
MAIYYVVKEDGIHNFEIIGHETSQEKAVRLKEKFCKKYGYFASHVRVLKVVA